MKFRTDFVTNSSSSSFICEICGDTTSSWDLGLSDAGMVQCVNGHVFCEEHLLTDTVTLESLKDWCEEVNESKRYWGKPGLDNTNLDELISYAIKEEYYELPECFCPICNFYEYSEIDLKDYLKKQYKVDENEAFEDVKKFNKRRKKLYDSEYNNYVANKFNLNLNEITGKWKEEFTSYRNFYSYIHSKGN